MTTKPTVLVTRKLPDAVEDRLKRDYEVRLNPDDALCILRMNWLT